MKSQNIKYLDHQKPLESIDRRFNYFLKCFIFFLLGFFNYKDFIKGIKMN